MHRAASKDASVKWVWKIGQLIPGWLLAMGLLALAYLHVIGFPQFARDFVETEFARRGVAVRFAELRLDLLRGIVATRAVLADARTPQQPLAEIDEVQLLWHWQRMIRGQNAVAAIRIANAEVAVPTPADEIGPEVFRAREAYALVRFDDDGSIRLDQLTGLYAGIRVNLRGRLKPSAVVPLPSGAAAAPPGAKTKPLTVVTKVVRELGRLRGIERTQLDVNFDIDMAQPWSSQVSTWLRGTDLSYRGLRVDEAEARVQLNRGAVEIETLRVALYGGAITVHGRYDFAQSQFDLQLQSTTDLTRLAVLLPADVVREVATVRFAENPQIEARYVLTPDTGPLPELTGRVTVNGLSVRGVEFRRIQFAFAGQSPVWHIRDAVVVTAEGQATGHGQIHAESTDFAYEFESTLDPVKLLPLMPPGVRHIVEPAWFGPPPRIVAKVRGDFVDPQAFAYDAEVSAGECSYRGVPLTGASAKLRLRTSRLDVQDLVLRRPEGELRGTVFANFDTHRVRFDVQTTANPTTMAPLLGPKAGALMQSYRFGPRTTARASGVVDFDCLDRTSWTAQAVNEGFSFWKFTATKAKAHLVFTNSTLAIRDFDADFYDGILRGQADFDFHGPEVTYRLELTPTRVEINKLLTDAGGRTKMTGYLTGTLQVDGRGDDLANLKGGGAFEVTDGIIWEGALFGIFSKILGNTKATSARATYTIGDNKVQTSDLEIAAGMFSAKSRGSVSFDGELDFRVEARFLSAIPGWNIVSSILGKVLEYRVGGTLGNPSYRANNFPKGLLPHED